jgi:hypothetical protein
MENMKNVTYFLTMILAVALMSTSCDPNDDPIVPDDTLETLYPEWADLQWVSTDGNTDASDEDNYPRLEITIVGDVVNIHQTINANGGWYNGEFNEIAITGNTITFSDDVVDDGFDDPNVTGTFSVDGNQITFTTFGLMTTSDSENEHTYVLE